jgi:hypothetical protein
MPAATSPPPGDVPTAFEPRFLATAIGSVPHHDVGEAVALVFSLLPEAPFWPQLPAADWREGMMAQYVEGLPGARLDHARRRVTLDIEDAVIGLEDVERAYESGSTVDAGISSDHAHGLHHFLHRLESTPAPRLVKGHVTGPVTLAIGLETSYEERAAIYEPDLARMIARWVGLKARHQEEAFARVAPSSGTLVFFDEPSMGSIGSAVLNLDADLAVELLATAVRACRGLTGIHCCGETDLGLVAAAGFDVLNFDAYDYLDSVVAAGPGVRSFVENGGMLAIGLVPSSLPHPAAVADETVDSLWARLLEVVQTLTRTGLDRDLLVRRSMITPSCGTGGMTVELARRSFELTARLSERARDVWF